MPSSTKAHADPHHHHHDADCDHAHCGHDHGPRRIYIYSPAGAVRDKAAFRRGVKRLQAAGHEVEIDTDALASHQRFAGDDAARVAAIHRACASGADVALISRGGYGLTRILPAIDYDIVAKAIAAGMKFVGFSDFTALQLAVLAKTGATTWAGPGLVGDFGTADVPDDIMEACFDDLIYGHGEGTGWRLPAAPRGSTAAAPDDLYLPKATLWGGNLAVLAGLVGTPFMPAVKNGVLFLEDVNEHPYRIERMLGQLLMTGILGRQKAIVLGQFTDFRLTPHDRGFKMASVVEWLRSQLTVPVLTGLPFGHVPTKVLLPVGAKVSLAVEGRDALIYWGHAH
ncbi:LD-carboxypeptidase [Xylophilus sp. GOD-11R]|uniref:LD-carboxypeptidase n=1 Tax=Xylophilus sp. GOD-11R TaxID=3089814 RepID=UPI00298BE9EB|nr:LD-carboxypeptidase [Xylophilus sp. GOD-11R]WPB59179.1 LD-carboxypeptidase [Xylophilus sp. GOD-11R]